jgi:hypothetical protein
MYIDQLTTDESSLGAHIAELRPLKHDLLPDTNHFGMNPEDGKLLVVGDDNITQAFNPTSHFIGQLASYTGIGRKYASKLIETNKFDLLAHNVNECLARPFDEAKQGQKRLIRTLDTNARALLSDSFLRFDNDNAWLITRPLLEEAGLEIVSCSVQPNKMYIKAVSKKLEYDVKVGMPVRFGICLTNSEVGLGNIQCFIFYEVLWCTNGATNTQTGSAYKRSHRGAKIENATLEYSQRTINAIAIAEQEKLRDAVTLFTSETFVQSQLQRLQDAANSDKIVNPVDASRVASETLQLTHKESDHVLEHLIRENDYSKWGLSNAVTRAAQDADNYTRASELEAIGDSVIDLKPTQWREIREAQPLPVKRAA